MKQLPWVNVGWCFLLACALSACTTREPEGSDGVEAATQDLAIDHDEMGCPGFEANDVPATYVAMKPCLEQLSWTLRIAAKKEAKVSDGTLTSDEHVDFEFAASGQQLVWRWEENGSHDGNYLLSGKENTLGELLVQRQGQAHLSSIYKMADHVRHTSIDGKAELAGPVAGTFLTALETKEDGRMCVNFDLATQMRGTPTTVMVPKPVDGSDVAPEAFFTTDAIVHKSEDGWQLTSDYHALTACSGKSADTLTEPYDAMTWSGLQFDEKAGSWSLSDSKTIHVEGSARQAQWTMDLKVLRVARTAKLPLTSVDR